MKVCSGAEGGGLAGAAEAPGGGGANDAASGDGMKAGAAIGIAPPTVIERAIRKSDDQPWASAFATATVPATCSPASRRVATNAVSEQAMP